MEKKIIDEIWKGNIPEYLSEAFVELTNHIVPFWLRKTRNGIVTYMAVGGRAANIQSKGIKLPSSDWDLLLFTDNDAVADEFTRSLADFIRGVIKTNEVLMGVVEKIEHWSSKINKGEFLWRIGIVDRFSNIKFPFVDIKRCPQIKGGKIGNLCDYNPSEVGGIFYAPRDLVKLDIERMSNLREDLLGEIFEEMYNNEQNVLDVNSALKNLISKSKLTAKEKKDILALIDKKSHLESVDIKHKLYASNFELKYKRQSHRAQYFA